MGLGITAWFEYVASKANIADFPSRGDFEMLMQLGSEERELTLPSLDGWDADVQLWVDLARSQKHRSRAAPIRAATRLLPTSQMEKYLPIPGKAQGHLLMFEARYHTGLARTAGSIHSISCRIKSARRPQRTLQNVVEVSC